jgi:lycopene beta-cyclase
LIEDTYYSNSPALSAGCEVEKAAILKYIQDKKWVLQSIDRQEVGILPIPMISRSPDLEIPTIGVRANLFHATTGYSFAEAVRLADEIATNPVFLETQTLFEALNGYIQAHLKKGNFFRFLNRMMFYGAESKQRRKIFERFYTLPEGLISRFYAGDLRPTDYARILVGKPPIPISKAMKCVFEPNRQGEAIDSGLGISDRTEA